MNADFEPVQATREWVERVVVGFNFCPFAKKVLVNNSIDFALSDATESDQALTHMLEKLHQLDTHDVIETSLLIFTQGFTQFHDYLDLYDAAATLVEQGGYAGIYQIASFHPDYVFEGESEEDASHYTNRSPLPMLHLIREQSMARILAQYPNPEAIPENNIALTRKMGVNKLAAILNACKQPQ